MAEMTRTRGRGSMDREYAHSTTDCVRAAVESGREIYQLRRDGARVEARALFLAVDALPWPYDYLAMLVLVGLSDGWVSEREVTARLLANAGPQIPETWIDWLEGTEDAFAISAHHSATESAAQMVPPVA